MSLVSRFARSIPVSRLAAALPLFLSAACGVAADGTEPTAASASALENGTVVQPGTEGAVFVGSPTNACTGTRIRNGWVLTAAHCLFDPFTLQPLWGVSVAVSSALGAESTPAVRTFVRPGFKPAATTLSPTSTDLALIQIAPDALTSVGTGATTLAGGPSSVLVNQHLRCYGSGDTSSSPYGDGALRRGDFLVNQASGGVISLVPGTQGSRFRSGDSGGPCFWDSPTQGTILVGVDQWSDSQASYFGLTDVMAANDWISGVLQGDRLDAPVPDASATTTTDAIAIANDGRSPSTTAVVVRAANGALRFKYQAAGGAWTPSADFQTIPLPVATIGAPSARYVDGALYVFATGTDRQLWTAKWASGYWTYAVLGGYLDSAPAVVSLGAGKIDVFAVDAATHQLAHAALRSGRWSSVGVMSSPALRSGSKPSAVVYDSNSAAVFAVASDGTTKVVDFTPGGHVSCRAGRFGSIGTCVYVDVSAWIDLGGYVTSDPIALAPTSTFTSFQSSWGVDVVARGGGNYDLFRQRATFDANHNPAAGAWRGLGLSLVSTNFGFAWDGAAYHVYASVFGALYACDANGDFNGCAFVKRANPSVGLASAQGLVDGSVAVLGTNASGEIFALRH